MKQSLMNQDLENRSYIDSKGDWQIATKAQCRQSAAKPRKRKVQRLSRKGVGASASKRGATIKVVDDIV